MIPPFNRDKIGKETDIVMALARGEIPDRITQNPLIFGLASTLHGKSIFDFYTKPKMGAQMLLNTSSFFGIPAMPCGATWTYGVPWAEEYGGTVKWPTGNAGAPGISSHPFSKPEDVDSFEPLSSEEISKGPTFKRLTEAMDETQKQLGPYFHAWGPCYEPFVIASYWFSPENMLLWVSTEPELVKEIMGKTVEFLVTMNTTMAKKYGDANLIIASLLANSQTMSPQQCWDFSLAYTKEMVSKSLKGGAGPLVWYHQCGDHEGDFALHADLPLPPGAIMHPAYWGLKPAPISETRKLFENKCILMGNVDTASFLNKSPNEVYMETKAQVEEGKTCKKGFISGVACEAPPFSPYANMEAFIRASRDCGRLK